MPTRVYVMPKSLVRLGRQLSATALTNARRAADDLAQSNADRRALQPVTADATVPGAVRRLNREECLQLLATKAVGRYAYVESVRALDVVPVNYVARPDGSVLFCTGPGPKLSAAARRDIVAFQVDDIDEVHHTGWSVLVVGRARRLRDVEVARLERIPRPWASGPRTVVVLIEPARIEGRRLT